MLGARSVTCYSIFSLALSTFLLTNTAIAQFGPSPECAGDEIGGVVYRDYNYSGSREVTEPGTAGVTVQAFNTSGALVASTLTDLDGAYKLQANGAVRVEFLGLGNSVGSGPAGNQSRTTVSFTSAPDCNVNLAVTNPAEYCQENPNVAIPCYISGDPLLPEGDSGLGSAFVRFPYNASGDPQAGTGPQPEHLALSAQIGSTWGVAYQRSSKKLFTSAVLKRHAGLGPLGTGGIYQIDLNTVPPTVSNFIDLKSVGIDTGVDPRDLPGDPGLPGSRSARSQDPNAFGAVGHTGLGDIDISEDENTLWVINLFDRKLYKLNIGVPAETPQSEDIDSIQIPNPGCSNDDYAPWALAVKDGATYVGVVCTAETSQNPEDLHAYILKLQNNSFTTVFDFSLDYTKGYSAAPVFQSKPGNGREFLWNPWAREMSDIYSNSFRFAHIGYPQPILTNIEFDKDGSMILGFMDRSGNQFAMQQAAPHNPDSTIGFASGGDLLRACAIGSNIWVLENNGACPTSGPTPGANNGQGPGGGEYYAQDYIRLNFQGNVIDVHQETALGGLVYKPGEAEVLASFFDVLTLIDGGVRAINNDTGDYVRGYQIYDRSVLGTFGKAVGLGDMELLCDNAPCEIGNRVWLDEDGDGSQDAGELGIPGVTVNLYDQSTNNFISSTTTNDSGEYLFNAENGLECGKSYKIRLNSDADYSNSGALHALILTSANADQDQRDSDAILEDGFGTISVTTAERGESNHTYDIGFTVPQCVFQDLTDTNATIDGSSVELEKLVKNAIKTRSSVLSQKYGSSCPLLSKKRELKLLERASALHISAWTSVWSLGSEATDCGDVLSAACVSTDISGTLGLLSADIEELYGLVGEAFKGCNVSDRKKRKIEKRALSQVKIVRSGIDGLEALNPFVTCPSSF